MQIKLKRYQKTTENNTVKYRLIEERDFEGSYALKNDESGKEYITIFEG